MDPPQFFGSYLKEKMCRFFKCKKGSITPENAESKCEFQGSFPWKSDQSLKDSGKREILKGCTISFLQTVKECDEDLNESVILENLRWIEDCPSNPDCQAIDHIECMDRSCNIPPDSCFGSSSESDESGSGSNVHPTPTSSIPHHSNPSPSSAPSQDSSEEENGQEEDDENFEGKNDEKMLSSSGEGEIQPSGWQKEVEKDIKSFIKNAKWNDEDDMFWSTEGRRLFLLTLDRPEEKLTLKDIWMTGVDSMRISRLVGQEVHELQSQVENMEMWSWRFNIGLLLPTSLAVATSLIILGNFCYKSHKFIAEKVNKVWTEKTSQKTLKTEKMKNLNALDMAIRIESMKIQGKKGNHVEKSGIIKLTDDDGNPIGVYNLNVNSTIPDNDQPDKCREDMKADFSDLRLPNVSTLMTMENEMKKNASIEALVPDKDDNTYSPIQAWKDRHEFHLCHFDDDE